MKAFFKAATALAAFFLFSCERNIESRSKELLPEHFPPVVHEFNADSLRESEIQLGRKLFYDPILSLDSSISCGSCHAQTHGFADHNVAVSFGVNGAVGSRNAPPLVNLAWHESYMLDGGINHLELVPLAPITHELEMNLEISEALRRLNKNSEYTNDFAEVYHTDTISTALLFKALTSFQLTLVSAKSKYDEVQRGTKQFTILEQQGEDLFLEHCSSCHQPPLFSDFSFANNGLDSIYSDAGRGRITQRAQDSGRFKVPTLRNLSFTYPYMHDGRFQTLDQVIAHYSNLENSGNYFDQRYDGSSLGSTYDKKALKAFLNTLNDYEFISDLQHSEPIN